MTDLKKELEPGLVGVEQTAKPEKIEQKPSQNLEVESWVERIERKFARVPNDTASAADDAVVVASPKAGQPPVSLPVSKQQMQRGKKAKTDTGIAWLVAWAIRQIKQLARLGRRVRIEDLPEAKGKV